MINMKQPRRNGLGWIIGSVPMFIVGILLIDIYVENIPNSLARLRTELIEYPSLYDEIISEITTTTAIGIVIIVIMCLFFLTSILFLFLGIRKKRMRR